MSQSFSTVNTLNNLVWEFLLSLILILTQTTDLEELYTSVVTCTLDETYSTLRRKEEASSAATAKSGLDAMLY